MEKIKKMPIIVLITIAILTTTILAASGTVNAPSGLVLRDEPSKSGSPITTLPDDAAVEIIEQSGEWYKVTYNGQEGYLFAEYVDASETITVAEPETPSENSNNDSITTNSENVQTKSEAKMYIMPLITSTPIGTMAAGTTVTIIKEITNWSYVTDGTNEVWIRTYAINEETVSQENNQTPEQQETPTQVETPTETQEQTPTQTETPAENNNQEVSTTVTKGIINVSAANVRKDASTSSEIVTTLTKDTDVEITAESGEWYKVKYTGIDGTIYEGYILKTLLQAN